MSTDVHSTFVQSLCDLPMVQIYLICAGDFAAARTGSLSGMVGGTETDFALVQPLLRRFATSVVCDITL